MFTAVVSDAAPGLCSLTRIGQIARTELERYQRQLPRELDRTGKPRSIHNQIESLAKSSEVSQCVQAKILSRSPTGPDLRAALRSNLITKTAV